MWFLERAEIICSNNDLFKTKMLPLKPFPKCAIQVGILISLQKILTTRLN